MFDFTRDTPHAPRHWFPEERSLTMPRYRALRPLGIKIGSRRRSFRRRSIASGVALIIFTRSIIYFQMLTPWTHDERDIARRFVQPTCVFPPAHSDDDISAGDAAPPSPERSSAPLSAISPLRTSDYYWLLIDNDMPSAVTAAIPMPPDYSSPMLFRRCSI